MEILLNIVFGTVALCIAASATASGQLDPSKPNYDLLAHLNLKSKTNETASDRNSKVSPTAFLSVSTSGMPTSSASPSGRNSSSPKMTPSDLITLNAKNVEELSRILEQDTTTISQESPQVPKQTTVSKADTGFAELNSINSSSTDASTNETSGSTTSPPDLSTQETKIYLDDFFRHSLSWLGDTYTLSIVVPIVAGFLFAMVIILTLVTFTCIRRRCRRRRLRRKILPETIRKMGPSDRSRLLAETSDEEF